MRRGGAGFIAAVLLAFAGCKSTDTKPDKETTGTPASRAKNNTTWLDNGERPAGPELADARNSGQDYLGGVVLDSSKKPVPGVYIQVEAVNPPPGSPPPVGIYSQSDGTFYTKGLKPGKTYNLTAELPLGGKLQTAAAQTVIPKTNVTLVLRDDLAMAPSGLLKGPAGSFPPTPAPYDPASERIPPTGIAQPARATEGTWLPDNSKPVPPSITPTPRPTPPGLPPATGTLPPPDDLTPKPANHPENTAERVKPWNAPPATIPGSPPGMPPVVPNLNPGPPPSPPVPMGTGAQGKGNEFILVDTLDRSWVFPAHKSGSIMLIDFMTTTCTPSKLTIPLLTELQARYATAGLQVIAVACDEPSPEKPRVDQKQRAQAAAKYMTDNSLNYQVYVEPGEVSGCVRDRFRVQNYPTAVLIDASGKVLWQDHPYNGRVEMEAAIKKALGK